MNTTDPCARFRNQRQLTPYGAQSSGVMHTSRQTLQQPFSPGPSGAGLGAPSKSATLHICRMNKVGQNRVRIMSARAHASKNMTATPQPTSGRLARVELLGLQTRIILRTSLQEKRCTQGGRWLSRRNSGFPTIRQDPGDLMSLYSVQHSLLLVRTTVVT